METLTTRNNVEARRIESWLQREMAEIGVTNIAREAGVNKSTACRWRENLLPNMSILLAIVFKRRMEAKGEYLEA